MTKMKVMASKKSVFAFIWSSRGRIKAEIQGESEHWSKLIIFFFLVNILRGRVFFTFNNILDDCTECYYVSV